MTKFSKLAIGIVGAVLTLAHPAQARDLVFGIGSKDFGGGAAIDLEFHSDPITRFAGADIALGFVLSADTKSDTFVGGGISAIRPIGDGPWFVEGSFMPGFFIAGSDATELGQALEFRTLIGVGRSIGNGYQVSVAASHKSNGGLSDFNPGVNAITLRLRRAF